MKIKLKENKTEEVGVLIFSMLDILGKVGIPLNGTVSILFSAMTILSAVFQPIK